MESAVESCDLPKTKVLVAADSQLVNKQGWSRTTPLYLAAQNNCLEVAQFLLENRAVVDARSTTGATPLHIAAEKGNVSIASLLLSWKADINAVDVKRRTPLDRALAWGHPEMAAFLKQRGSRKGNPLTQTSIDKSDKLNLDIFWFKDDPPMRCGATRSLEDGAN